MPFYLQERYAILYGEYDGFCAMILYESSHDRTICYDMKNCRVATMYYLAL